MRTVSDRTRESPPPMNSVGIRSPDQSRTPCCPGGRPANPCRRDDHWQMRRAWRHFEKVEQCENRQQELGAFRHFFLWAWCPVFPTRSKSITARANTDSLQQTRMCSRSTPQEIDLTFNGKQREGHPLEPGRTKFTSRIGATRRPGELTPPKHLCQ
jgi:hypothetical protein